MMEDLGDELAWRVCLTLLHVLAITSTIFRLYRRRRFQQLWWDDHVASFCLFLDCLFFSTLWIQERKSRDVLIFTSWLLHTVFISLTWCSRISLSLTITRIIPPLQPIRKVNIFLTFLYALCGVAFTVQIGVACSANPANWMNTEPYLCPLSKTTAASRITVDFVADLVLIIVPLVAFWRLKLPLATRRLVQACFCASLLTAASMMLMAGLLFFRAKTKLETTSDKNKRAFMASVFSQLTVTVSLLVCNMLIVVTSFYCMFRSEAPALANVGAVHRAIAAAHIDATMTERTDTQDLRSGAPSTYLSGTYSTEGRSGAYTTFSSTIQPLELTQIYESDFSYSYPTNATDHNPSISTKPYNPSVGISGDTSAPEIVM